MPHRAEKVDSGGRREMDAIGTRLYIHQHNIHSLTGVERHDGLALLGTTLSSSHHISQGESRIGHLGVLHLIPCTH